MMLLLLSSHSRSLLRSNRVISSRCQLRQCVSISGNRSSSSTEIRYNGASTTNPRSSLRKYHTTLGDGSFHVDDPYCNIPPHIAEKVRRPAQLYHDPNHPLTIVKEHIEDYFLNHHPSSFVIRDSLSPIVSTTANFDSLLIPNDHVSRGPSDTYYVNPQTVLRTHTSAHQLELLQQGNSSFLCTGEVYRRDDIDQSHYPIFHQMEGVHVVGDIAEEEIVLQDLKATLEGLALHLFGSDISCRWVDEYFPFTHPSQELEIFYRGEWLEVLGCGVMRQEILDQANIDKNKKAWAFGLGLERLAMILFDIPDIRLFWSEDGRFTKQFTKGDLTTIFVPYSKYPPCFKDVSFWIEPDENANDQKIIATDHARRPFHVNELLDVTREIAGDWVETVELTDQFVHPKTQRESHCYRITYRSMDRSLTNEQVDGLQEQLRDQLQSTLSIELR